ncbi:hypothetical protein ATANTOWER_008271 [Ataeniobius toweri]|uniref:Uncharacterized protein n=1 Tax=Ataeniobius toweri TaxID=208326 RepID=A0ABU7BFF9_9TELE|nr:hypothetical protein [Ataeniobius toweri]
MDLINSLVLCFQGSSVQLAAAVNCTPVMTTAPLPFAVTLLCSSTSATVFECAKGFMHKVKESETGPTVCQKLRLFPLSVSAMSAEILRLLQALAGVIEKMYASP